jgi:hypothetical protein
VSRQMHLRAAVVAVAGIALGALSQASLIDGSVRPQSLPSAQTVTAGHPKLSYSARDVGQACAAGPKSHATMLYLRFQDFARA